MGGSADALCPSAKVGDTRNLRAHSAVLKIVGATCVHGVHRLQGGGMLEGMLGTGP